jgi:hypothetical protein
MELERRRLESQYMDKATEQTSEEIPDGSEAEEMQAVRTRLVVFERGQASLVIASQ